MLRVGKKLSLFTAFLLAIMMFFAVSCSPTGTDDTAPDDKNGTGPRYGGVLKSAYGANPSTLDAQKGTGQAVREICWHMGESLFDLDSNFFPKPGLAESHSVSEDGFVHTVKLREGVLFHNGKEMTAEDVVASVVRWIDVLPSPPELALFLDSVEVVDRYTMEFHLIQPHGDFLWMITTLPLIYPKEICERYGMDYIPDHEVIGTGPYKLKERVHDRYVHMVRFEDYSPRDDEPDGWSGRKYAYADEIIFYIVPDQSVRTMGVETGQYHHAHGIEYGDYGRIYDHPNMMPVPQMPHHLFLVPLNCANSPTSDVKIRQAIQAAIDCRVILDAVYVYPELFRLECSLLPAEVKLWYTEAGCGYYNQGDPEKAKQLLKESGYNGETIVVIGMTEYDFLKNAVIIIKEQLENVGFKVDLLLSDQATYIARFINKDSWHVACHTSAITTTVPSMFAWTREEHMGWWMGETPRKLELGELLRTETDHVKRFAIWEELQELAYHEAREVRIGTTAACAAVHISTGGWFDTTFQMPGLTLWNIWLKN